MKIAIHNSPGGFHQRWRAYCEEKGIPFKSVNCYASDLIDQLEDCDALMWQHHQGTPQDLLCAKQILFALQQSGKTVFPDFNTGWHFDDKVGQKYLFEALGIPAPSSYVFYDKKEAVQWAASTTYPVVFKLRSGAGSQNVLLVRSAHKARGLIRKAFGRGFSKFNRITYMKDRISKSMNGLDGPMGILKGVGRLFIPTNLELNSSREKGYAYFQEFIGENDSDTRIVVIGDRAFGIRRLVRKNDFRASGSGMLLYSREEIDTRCLKAGFDMARKLKTQCVAFDFVYKYGEPMIIEVSFAFIPKVYDPCPGFWDEDLTWREGPFNPYGWMVERVIADIKK